MRIFVFYNTYIFIFEKHYSIYVHRVLNNYILNKTLKTKLILINTVLSLSYKLKVYQSKWLIFKYFIFSIKSNEKNPIYHHKEEKTYFIVSLEIIIRFFIFIKKKTFLKTYSVE